MAIDCNLLVQTNVDRENHRGHDWAPGAPIPVVNLIFRRGRTSSVLLPLTPANRLVFPVTLPRTIGCPLVLT